jgi:AcrR family transcriptional regulator
MPRTLDPVRHNERRSALLAVAGSLFAEQGLSGTSIAQICAAAGVSSGQLFHYFPSKDAIFAALFENDAAEARAVFIEVGQWSDPFAALVEAVRRLAAPAGEVRVGALILDLIRRVERDAGLAAALIAEEDVKHDGLTALLVRAQASGQVDTALDPNEAARWIRSLIDATFLNSTEEPRDGLSMLLRTVRGFLVPATHELALTKETRS